MIRKALSFVRSITPSPLDGPVGPATEASEFYQRGYRDALVEVEEYILDLMWKEGVDEGEPEEEVVEEQFDDPWEGEGWPV